VTLDPRESVVGRLLSGIRFVPLKDELIEAIQGWDVDLKDIEENTPLLKSGLFDSLALFNLVQWVEEKTGGPVDPTTFDLVEEWNTVANIVKFVTERRKRPMAV
jgi:acyl carrier protein